MPRNYDQKVVEYITASSAAIDKAAAALGAYETQQQQAAAAIPDAVDSLIRAGLVTEKVAAVLKEKLADPAKAIAIVGEVAEKYAELCASVKAAQQLAPSSLGRPEVAKQASSSSRGPVIVGQRTSAPRESDINFAAALGVGRTQ